MRDSWTEWIFWSNFHYSQIPPFPQHKHSDMERGLGSQSSWIWASWIAMWICQGSFHIFFANYWQIIVLGKISACMNLIDHRALNVAPSVSFWAFPILFLQIEPHLVPNQSNTNHSVQQTRIKCLGTCQTLTQHWKHKGKSILFLAFLQLWFIESGDSGPWKPENEICLPDLSLVWGVPQMSACSPLTW